MQRYSFKMFLNQGCEAEYRKRHDAIWPELASLLREAGVANYSIHWDAETSVLLSCRNSAHRDVSSALTIGRPRRSSRLGELT